MKTGKGLYKWCQTSEKGIPEILATKRNMEEIHRVIVLEIPGRQL